jgi:uncharacterized protein (DUF1499 family)
MRGLLIVATALVLAGCASVAERPADGQGLAPCPSSPNCVCSNDSGGAAIAPFAIEGEAENAWRVLREVLEAEPRMEIVAADARYLHAVATTRILRFKDDLEFLLDRDAGTIGVRSASRVGYSDLGANRRRIEALRAQLAARGVIAAE